MSLQGACPELSVVTSRSARSSRSPSRARSPSAPGCAVSRVRTGLPANELTCAFPARALADIVGRLSRSLAADAAVSAYADADLARTSRRPDRVWSALQLEHELAGVLAAEQPDQRVGKVSMPPATCPRA